MKTYATIPALLALAVAGLSSAAEGLQALQTIGDGSDGVSIKNHVGTMTVHGNYAYVSVQYDGSIKCFKRGEDGQLTYFDDLTWAGKCSVNSFVWANGFVYFTGGSGHQSNDSAASGLHWASVDPSSGTLKAEGNVKMPLIRKMLAGSDGKSLYLFLRGDGMPIQRCTLQPNGTPEPGEKIEFPEIKGRSGTMQLTADGKMLLVLSGDREYALHRIAIEDDGKLVYHGADPMPELTEDIDWPKGKFGYGWGHGFGVSPDGRHLYADFCNYGGKDARVLLYDRDPESGALKFKERIEAAPMQRVKWSFHPDGTSGYFASGPECKGNVCGWFTRDPETGRLTLGGTVKETQRIGPHSAYLDAENGYYYACGWNKHVLVVMKIRP